MPSIGASIVTYHPDPHAIRRLVKALLPQVSTIVIVDNGSPNLEWAADWPPQVHLLTLPHNIGVAAGHNRAVSELWQHGVSEVVMFDQDSLPAADMIQQLLAAKAGISGAIAAVGPQFSDPRYGYAAPFVRLEGWKIHKHPGHPTAVVAADYLITSGCLITRETWQHVGPLDETLFIDYVDIEWGLRALAAGYRSYGVCAAHMEHNLGDDPIFFWGRRIPLHSPLRHYYHVRNAVALYRRRYISLRWKLNDGYRLLLKFVFYSLLTRQRWRHCSAMSRGIWHGLIGRLGPAP